MQNFLYLRKCAFVVKNAICVSFLSLLILSEYAFFFSVYLRESHISGNIDSVMSWNTISREETDVFIK